MRRFLPILVLAALAGGAYYYFQLNPPVHYATNEVYLTRYASVMTPTGVYGFPPGTMFSLDSNRHGVPGTVAVTDGRHRLDVATDALTRNPKIAEELAAADQQGQTQAVAGVAAAKQHVAKVEADAQMARARDVDRLNAKQRSIILPPAPTPTATPTVRRVP